MSKHKMNPEDLYTKTGECLADLNVTSVVVDVKEHDKPNNEESFVIHYKKYFVVSEEAIAFIIANFNVSDTGRIIQLPPMTKVGRRGEPQMNILYKTQRTPHTQKSLQEHFQMSRSKFSEFLNRLLKKNVVAKTITYHNEKKLNVITLNPYLTRKHLGTHNELKKIFKPLVIQASKDDSETPQ